MVIHMRELFITTMLLFAVVRFSTAYGQSTGGWERTDLFGNPNSLNNSNFYTGFLIQGNDIFISGDASVLFGYWTRYTLQGQAQWQKKARNLTGGRVAFPWRNGFFAYSSVRSPNRIGFAGIYYWLNGRGDTVRVRGLPAMPVVQLAAHAASRDGRYYIAGSSDGSGTGQTPLALHYSLVCLDTAGNFRWQRQYLNPTIRLAPQVPAYVGGYAYLQQIVEAPRQGWLLLGHTQRDSANFQLYAIEVDSGGQPRRTRWVEPFGRNASLYMYYPANAVRLRDGSGYIVSGQVRFDSLNRARVHGFVSRLDTALRVVWRTLLEAPPLSPAAPSAAGHFTGAVQEAADGSLRLLTYQATPRVVANEFDVLRLDRQTGRLTRRDTYCSQVCTAVYPDTWQLMPNDSTVIVCGWGQQRDPGGWLLAQPAWLARFDAPCRRQVLTNTRAGQAAATGGMQLYPQPAAPGSVVRLALARAVAGTLRVQLLDALGRSVAVEATGNAQDWQLTLPAELAPGLYAVRVSGGAGSVTTGKLLVQAE
jgi:hypothetical protein